MEVIFDTPNLRPVLSPSMRTTLSVISLIANSLVEANKCMKERLAEEAGTATTLDQVMQQSGLKIPGLEEALAQLIGSGPDARKTASMIVNTPDPVKLLQAFAAEHGFASAAASSQKSGPSVTPPPTATADTPPASSAWAWQVPGPAPGLAPFRADFTREGREAAKAAAATSVSAPERQQAAQAHVVGAGKGVPDTVARLSLVGGVVRQLDAMRRQRKVFEAMVHARLVALEAELARLREEFAELQAALLRKAESRADEAAAAATAAAADEAVASPDADANATRVVVPQQPDIPAEDPLPPAATPEEVVQAIQLIEEFAVETQTAEEQQLTRISTAEQEVARMRGLLQRAREVQENARAYR